jgi:predicted heme/steroid binding protein
MKKQLYFTTIVVTTMIALIACVKNENPFFERPTEQNYDPKPGDVYIAWTGAVFGNDILTLALVSKPGVLFGLSSDSSNANSVFVYGNDVYIAGRRYTEQGNAIAVLWKNFQAQNLTDEVLYGNANSVYVSNGDVYVAGFERNTRGIYVAKLWKNGIAQNLTDGTYNGNAFSVFVYGSDVYVAGGESNAQDVFTAKLWKNGITQNLTDGTRFGAAYSVFVYGSDVYTAGIRNNNAVVWKNGVAQDLTTDGITNNSRVANSVFVSDGNVYVAGRGGNNVATLWKNGIPQGLSGGQDARSVFVSGSDVYVVGNTGFIGFLGRSLHQAIFWKNGERQVFPASVTWGRANSVFVVE